MISSKNVRNRMQIYIQVTDRCAPSISLNRKCNDKGLKVCKQSQGKDALETLKYEQVKSLFIDLCRKYIVRKSHHLWCFIQTDRCECKLSSTFSFSLPKQTGSYYPGLWKHRSSSCKSHCSKYLIERDKGNQVGWWAPDPTMSICTAQPCNFTDLTFFWYL